MSFRDFPDCTVPEPDFRCDALTKPHNSWPDWSRTPHRCVRRATRSRAGRAVCFWHDNVKDVQYWDGTPDSFPTPRNRRTP